MYQEIIDKIKQQIDLDWENKTIHLGVFSEPYLTYMLKKEKTIESRFSKNKIAPYNKVKKEDIILVKKSSGNVVAFFTVKEIIQYNLNEVAIEEIKSKYQKQLCLEDKFWNQKRNSNYVVLIKIDEIKVIEPFSIPKKGMQTWIVLN